jgi:hypothetical protein
MDTFLSWKIDSAALTKGSSAFEWSASDAERAELASELELKSLNTLRASIRVKPLAGERFAVTGIVTAELVQASVVSMEPVESLLREEFEVEFRQEKQELAAGEGVDMSPEGPDTEPVVDGHLDMGRVIHDILATAVDPYPRKPGEIFEWEGEAGKVEDSPFGMLHKLKQ